MKSTSIRIQQGQIEGDENIEEDLENETEVAGIVHNKQWIPLKSTRVFVD